jgi:hypothetical protein
LQDGLEGSRGAFAARLPNAPIKAALALGDTIFETGVDVVWVAVGGAKSIAVATTAAVEGEVGLTTIG